MFSKKCPKCSTSVRKEYDFCPYCGLNLATKNDKDDYGMLGKNDMMNDMSSPLSGSGMMDKLLENAMRMAEKMLEKEMNGSMNNSEKRSEMPPRLPGNLHVQFFVNGKKIPIEPNQQVQQKIVPIKIENKISNEKKEKLARLPRQEPVSKVRRISGKVIYELSVPGVENIEDVLINQLESSIEVKAISDEKIYSKTLNIKLPIIGYNLKEGNLVLELQAM